MFRIFCKHCLLEIKFARIWKSYTYLWTIKIWLEIRKFMLIVTYLTFAGYEFFVCLKLFFFLCVSEIVWIVCEIFLLYVSCELLIERKFRDFVSKALLTSFDKRSLYVRWLCSFALGNFLEMHQSPQSSYYIEFISSNYFELVLLVPAAGVELKYSLATSFFIRPNT